MRGSSAAVDNLAGKVVFLDRFQHGGLRLRVELSASLSLVLCLEKLSLSHTFRRKSAQVFKTNNTDMYLLLHQPAQRA